jgi:hypothetical protein
MTSTSYSLILEQYKEFYIFGVPVSLLISKVQVLPGHMTIIPYYTLHMIVTQSLEEIIYWALWPKSVKQAGFRYDNKCTGGRQSK